jgi:purine-binding chemotaxis protein CheW
VPALEPFEPLADRGERTVRGPRALLLAVGADRYGVALEQVRVVLEAPGVTRLPDGPPAVLGVTNVRGEVVPVVDLGAALGVGALGRAPFAAVVEVRAGLVALASADVPETAELEEELGKADLAGATVRHAAGGHVVAGLDVEAVLRAATGA